MHDCGFLYAMMCIKLGHAKGFYLLLYSMGFRTPMHSPLNMLMYYVCNKKIK